jgi:hypothetical protein
MRSRRTPFIVAILAGVLLLTACPSRTTISKINADPGRFYDKEVGIAGKVTESYGIPLLGGAYELDDDTGKIWVISKRGVPSRGTRVGAKGRVQSGVTFGARSFGTVLIESERRSK